MSKLQTEWANGHPMLLMFQDEARFGRISDVRRCWCPKPFRPICPLLVSQENTYAYGAVNVINGEFESLILPHCDTTCMQIFLDEISRRHPDERIVMVVDGAGWHKSKTLNLPENMRLIHLPPYSPELNPVEHIWDELREKGFHNKVFSSLEALEDHLLEELRKLEDNSDITKSIVAWPWIINAFMK